MFNNIETLRNEQESKQLSQLEEDFEKKKTRLKKFFSVISDFGFSVLNIKDKFGEGKQMEKTEKEDDVEHQDNQVTVQVIHDSALDKLTICLDENESKSSNVVNFHENSTGSHQPAR